MLKWIFKYIKRTKHIYFSFFEFQFIVKQNLICFYIIFFFYFKGEYFFYIPPVPPWRRSWPFAPFGLLKFDTNASLCSTVSFTLLFLKIMIICKLTYIFISISIEFGDFFFVTYIKSANEVSFDNDSLICLHHK